MDGSASIKAPTVNEFDFTIRDTDWITTCNAQEMFPGPGTPLTISTFGKAIEIAMQRLHVDFGVLDAVDESKHPRTPWFYGHFFINMTNVLEVTMRLPLGNHAKANAEMSLLGRKNPEETLSQLRDIHGESYLFKKIVNGLFYAKAIAFASWRIPVMEQRKLQVKRLLRKMPSETPKSLYSRIDELLPEYNNQWADGILTSSPSAGWMLLIMKLISKSTSEMWSTQRLSELSTVLSDSAGNNVESADAVKTLNVLKETIANSEYARAFASWPVGQAVRFLERAHSEEEAYEGSSPQAVYHRLIERHGHRCVKEAEFRNKDWSEDPTSLVMLLQENVSAMLNSKKVRKNDSITLDEMLKTNWSHVSCFARPLLRYAVHQTRAGVARREYGKSMQVHVHSSFKHAYRRLGKLLVEFSIVPEEDLIYFFTHEELKELINATSNMQMGMIKRAIQRRQLLSIQETYSFDDLGCGIPKPHASNEYKHGSIGDNFKGTPVSVGSVIGLARVVRTLKEAGELRCGEILVCPFTDVGWTPYFSLASGLITEIGGLLSHGAVVAREYGLPCVVNVKGATRVIKTGDTILLDGATGSVKILK